MIILFWVSYQAVSLVEMGGMDDVSALRQRTALRATPQDIEQYIRQVLHQSHLAQKTILLGLRAPYLVQRLAAEFTPMATMVTYDYRVDDTSYESVVFETLSQFLTQGISQPEQCRSIDYPLLEG